MTTYLLTIDAPHPSLLPLGYQKLREIGIGVNDAFETPDAYVARVDVPAWLAAITGRNLDQDPACPRCASALEPIPDAGMVCVREGCRS